MTVFISLKFNSTTKLWTCAYGFRIKSWVYTNWMVLVDISINCLIKSSTQFDCSFWVLAIKWFIWVYAYVIKLFFFFWSIGPLVIIPCSPHNLWPKSIETPCGPCNHCPKVPFNQRQLNQSWTKVKSRNLSSFHPFEKTQKETHNIGKKT